MRQECEGSITPASKLGVPQGFLVPLGSPAGLWQGSVCAEEAEEAAAVTSPRGVCCCFGKSILGLQSAALHQKL